jgi:hypothetical protein
MLWELEVTAQFEILWRGVIPKARALRVCYETRLQLGWVGRTDS